MHRAQFIHPIASIQSPNSVEHHFWEAQLWKALAIKKIKKVTLRIKSPLNLLNKPETPRVKGTPSRKTN
jgi:hypothetical protein